MPVLTPPNCALSERERRMGPYRTIIADPPWSYNNNSTRGAALNHYPTMTDDAICALPVGDLAAPDAILLLWATWPKLVEAQRVIAAWGFEYVTGFPWIKIQGAPRRNLWDEYEYRPQFGVGFWVRGCSEPLLVARRGVVSPPVDDQIGLISENFRHSRKPENLYNYAERLPGPYLELFARRPRAGWDVWGNEIASTIEVGRCRS